MNRILFYMKRSVITVCMLSCIVLFTECKNGAVADKEIVSIEKAYDSDEVAFEDVAADVCIVPLISDEPLDECNRIRCYGSTAVICAGLETIYFFDDGKLTAELNRVGRGPGEYPFISDYIYSPGRKILYVRSGGTNTILKYSVPELKYLGSFEIDSSMSCFAEHDDSTLLCRMASSDGSFADYFIDADNGEVRGMLKKVSAFSVMMDGENAYYSPDHRILLELGSLNTISEVGARVGDGENILCQFDFGKDSYPARLDSVALDMDFVMEMVQYSSSREETIVSSVGRAMATEGSVSFWYGVGMLNNQHYCRITGDDIVKYSGFKAKGMDKPILPTGLTDNGYVTIIDGLAESLFDSSGERSNFTAELDKAMNSQEFNNPVLVFYSIR